MPEQECALGDLMVKLFVTVLRVSDPPTCMHKASLLARGSQGGHSLNVHLSLGHMSRQLQRALQTKEYTPESARCGYLGASQASSHSVYWQCHHGLA